MRGWMMSLVALSLLVSMVGCKHGHTHGMCDCEFDDLCSSRAPWVRMGGPVELAPTPLSSPLPMKLPEVKSGLQ